MKISIKIHRQDPVYKYWFKTSTVSGLSTRHTVILFAKLFSISIFTYKKKAFKTKAL